MVSNHYTRVCVPCRNVTNFDLKDDEIVCRFCGGPSVVQARWSAPKKSDDTAWKRIAKGEWLWDRRRVRRVKTKSRRLQETTTHYDYRKVEEAHEEYCSHECCNLFRPWYRLERIPGPCRQRVNYNQLPNADLGA